MMFDGGASSRLDRDVTGQPPKPQAEGIPGATGATHGGSSGTPSSEQGEPPFLPAPTLPKGGGAIRGIGEKVSINPAKGTCSLSIPIYTSPARLAPELALSYDSGAGNSPMGLGWSDAVPRITRKTDKGLPRYTDDDTFLLSGAEDLVPSLVETGAGWLPDIDDETIDGEPHRVERFRPRTEGAFTRIERCRNLASGDVHWRSVSRDNVTSVYGRSTAARIADPARPDDPSRVFEWLLEETHDDRGNVVAYEYKAEDTTDVADAVVWERNRLNGVAPVANSYLKWIRYGNRTAGSGAGGWHFVVAFDYGDHDLLRPTPEWNQPWPARPDAFSTYRAGFEVRTRRLCRRVLVFHDFPHDDLGDGPLPRLVRSTDLSHEPDPAGTRLVAVTQTGYVWDEATGSYLTESLPPLELEYTRAHVDDEVRSVDPDSLDNLPVGVDGEVYQFVDLDGEGLPGALTQQGGAWFYKRNLGGGRFGAQERVPTQPSVGSDGGSIGLVDLAGDGRRALVRHGPIVHGYQEREQGGDGGWAPFASFAAVPMVDWDDPALFQTDLDGDGLTDLLVAEGEAFRWHRSLGRDGYAPEQRVTQPADEQRGPVLLRSDPTCAVLLADMSGDGLADLVRVRNGEVCYWPCLGHGRFGAQVTMAGSPVFDHPDLFDASRLRLADVDGSGPIDLVYLGRGEVRYWPNQSGNAFGPTQVVAAFPDVDRLDTVDVVDLLGTGTSCLVWSSPLPRDSGRQLRYVDLCRAAGDELSADDPGRAGHKPNLLRAVHDNLGGETRVAYAPSTRFFLADRAAGTPWVTRLPFPVHVVERQETYDHVARTRLVSIFAYRHGYYDGAEREFRGFGMVEQTDAETLPGEQGAGLFAEPEATELHRPPVRTRTWFHTGAFLDEHVVADHFATEYYDGDPAARPLDDSELPAGLTDREAREARRALAGQPLRTEVYADDGSTAAAHPYTVTEHRYWVMRMQPAPELPAGSDDDRRDRERDRHAVFLSHPLETVTAHYERDPADPRVGHELTLEVDGYGNVLQTASIGYPRRIPDVQVPEQGRTSVLWTVNRVANVDGPAEPYRLGVPVETQVYEVTALPPAPAGGLPGTPGRYRHADLAAALSEIATQVAAGEPGWEIPYESAAEVAPAHPQRRLVEHVRSRYWNDSQTAPLPLGEPGARALVHETYKIAFTPGLLAHVYGDRVDAALLAGEGRYLLWDGVWWAPSGVRHYDTDGFFLPFRMVDPFGNESSVDYDDHHLLAVATHASHVAPLDVLVTRVDHDYRLLSPRQTTDPNGNRSLVAYDRLGRVEATWVRGKADAPAEEGDPVELPGTVCTYDAKAWSNGSGPVWAHVETRERHGDPDSPWQRARAWSDGSGRVAMTKAQAEPGPAWTLDGGGQPVLVDTELQGEVRWVGTGRTVFDNKGQPVKQYEPYFSVAPDYEDEAALVEQGVTPILHYDPLGRLVRTEHPDGTESRVVFGPWRQETWDANDTVLESRWYADRGSPDPAAESEPTASDRRAAWLAAQHAGTPAVTHLDALGRAVVAVADGGPLGQFETCTEFDVEGNTRSVTDARGVVVLRQDNDLAGRVLHTVSPDAGERWTLPDVAGTPIRSWDSRGHAFRRTYDLLRRPVELWVVPPPSDNDDGQPIELLVELTVYGEALPDAAERNLRGRAFLVFDGAGMTVAERHDFKGNLLAGHRQLALTYETSPDWSSLAGGLPTDVAAAAQTLLEPEQFASTTEYDALNRPVTQVLPDATVVVPGYNEAGLLETVSARLQGASALTLFVTDLDYDAKGQRMLIAYGNGTRTSYKYDRWTYRLVQLVTERGPDASSESLQDLNYTYDPVGNVVEIRDDAKREVFFANQVVTPSARYTYDALARLRTATGREHISLGPQPDHVEPGLGAGLPHQNDSQAVRLYTQTYTYDGVGNILTMAHAAGPSGSWTREYDYAGDSNRLLSHSRPSPPTPATFGYDVHGNMTSLPHVPKLTWDHADRLQTVDLIGGGTAFYRYDSSGQRVRKVIDDLGGQVEERLYLGGFEVHRRRLNGTVTFERQTIHMMDDTRRIALVETTTVDDSASSDVGEPRIRYQLGNHLGSCSLELDQSAAVISYEEYHPYGTTSLWLAAPGTEVKDRRYRYTGKEKDHETGLYYHGARYYVPWLARWTSPDPSGLSDGLDRYRYAQNNPVTYFDPNGADTCDPTVASCSVNTGDPLVRAHHHTAQDYQAALGENIEQNRAQFAPDSADAAAVGPSGSEIPVVAAAAPLPSLLAVLAEAEAAAAAAAEVAAAEAAWAAEYPLLADVLAAGKAPAAAAESSSLLAEVLAAGEAQAAAAGAVETSAVAATVGESGSAVSAGLAAAPPAAETAVAGSTAGAGATLGLAGLVVAALFMSDTPLAKVSAAPALPPEPSLVQINEKFAFIVEEQNQRLANDLTIIGNYEPRLYNTIMTGNLSGDVIMMLAKIGYGRALEGMVEDRIRSDPQMSQYFVYLSGANRPDWAGAGPAEGLFFDLTTKRGLQSHIDARPYGENLVVHAYERPSSVGW